MQLEECCKICGGANVNYYIPYKEDKFSNIALSSVAVSFIDHDFVLVLTSPSNITK